MKNKSNLTDDILIRIFKNINIPINNNCDVCWNWQGTIGSDGYGRTTIYDKSYRIHRIIYEIYNGPFDKTKFICHKCDNPICVNPTHLFIGTTQENTQDKVNKNRQTKGSNVNTAVLTENDVINILLGIHSGKYKNQTEIRKKYGVRPTNILRGKNWKEISNKVCIQLNTTLDELRNKVNQDKSVYISRSLFSDDEVRIIRNMLLSGKSGIDISKLFNVSDQVIYNIKNNKTYKNVI